MPILSTAFENTQEAVTELGMKPYLKLRIDA